MENPNRILLSEDTDLWQGIFARLLVGKRFELHQAKTLAATISELERCFFNVVIVDLALDPEDESRLDGIQTMEKIRQLDEGTQAIVLTGRGTVELAVGALRDFKVYDFMEKEKFDRDRFLATLEEANTKAYRGMIQPGRLLPPDAFIGPLDWHRFSSRLEVRQNDLKDVFCGLVGNCMPVRFRGKTLGAELTAGNDALTTEFWSKGFGKAVRIFVGKHGQATQSPVGHVIYSYHLDTAAGIVTAADLPFARYVG